MANPTLVSLENGKTRGIKGLRTGEGALGWTSDGLLYVKSEPDPKRFWLHIDKLNPNTGARTVWRDLSMPPVGGVVPETLMITPDGASYGSNYRLRLSDLYTITRVR